jgi:ABC-type transporter Mla subunit MlaD
VGQVSEIVPKQRPDGTSYAEVTLKLDKEVEPLPADSTLLVRPRSPLGLKYLELTPGSASAGLRAGATIPISQARPEVVEIDDVFNMFDDKARIGSRNSIDGLGTGLAGRGRDINTAIDELGPLLENLEPVARNLSDPRTRIARFFKALADTATEAAPVAEQQAQLFVSLDASFTALASIARPFLQESISEGPPTADVAIRDFPRQRPFIRNNAALLRELRPGVATLPHSAPILADAVVAGTENLPKTIQMNSDLADVFDTLADFGTDPLVRGGVDQLTRLSSSLRPTLRFLTPVQTTCNYVTLLFRNAASHLSEGDANGTWQRFTIIPTIPLVSNLYDSTNNEIGPASAPANGPGRFNFLHSNPYPNTASPGQTKECEAGNERFVEGRQMIGNPPGNQGTRTNTRQTLGDDEGGG